LNKKNIPALLLLFSLVCSLILAYQLEVTYASEQRMIDLFTQKKPYDGKGLNQSSDAFAPQEEVILYANLTYRDAAVANKLVAFEIFGPVNSLNSITFSRIATTNASGIAKIDFRIPWLTETSETVIFGTWKAYANAEIAEVLVEDTLTFEVGWIVEIISLTTVDQNLQPQTRFARGTCMGVRIVLKNIAMLPKKVTLTISAFDAMRTFIIGASNNFEVNPRDVYTYTNCNLQIPEWATIGDAVVNASAYTAPLTEGGVPYCPEVSETFLITVCDVAVVSVIPSVTSVVVGKTVNLLVVVKNQGSNAETFNVTAYADVNVTVIGDETLIGTQLVPNLAPGNQTTLTFAWNTSGLPDDNYVISAVASVLPGEIDINDNTYVNEAVAVRSMPIYAVQREFSFIGLVVAVAIAMILIVLIMSRRKKRPSQNPSILLHVDVLP
jgi:hypothetical protein